MLKCFSKMSLATSHRLGFWSAEVPTADDLDKERDARSALFKAAAAKAAAGGEEAGEFSSVDGFLGEVGEDSPGVGVVKSGLTQERPQTPPTVPDTGILDKSVLTPLRHCNHAF